MSPSRFLIAGLVLSVAALILPLAVGSQKADEGTVERRLIIADAEDCDRPIGIKVGEVLQVSPFQLPVIPKFLDAEVDIRLSGDRVLGVIGQHPTASTTEGASGKSIFFYAMAGGQTKVDLQLLDRRGRPIEGYSRSYKIDCQS